MRVLNTTHLDTRKLTMLLHRYADGWPHERLVTSVRYSRGAEFSGSCVYARQAIRINIRRHLTYPYAMGTHIARARSNATHWWKEIYYIHLADEYQLVLFVFLHELYHWLIRRARRNTRQKESMCDRFAARVIVDDFGGVVVDASGRRISRDVWDFQDLLGFVAPARHQGRGPERQRLAIECPLACGVLTHSDASATRLRRGGILFPNRSATG